MGAETITTDTNIKTLIANGLGNSDKITINDGATLTIDETPSILLGDVIINEGICLVDGTNIAGNNIINMVGSGGLTDGSNDNQITIYGPGLFKVLGDWYDIGTTNGTTNQSIDMSSTGSYVWKVGASAKYVDTLSFVQVETGRKISFNSFTGVLPTPGDILYKKTNQTVVGKVVSATSNEIIVEYLIGSIATNDEVIIKKIVDNFGADYQISFSAIASAGDIKAPGIYTEWGNARSNKIDYTSDYGAHRGGFIFHHAFGTESLTIGGAYTPPSGCNIRIPNVHLNTSSVTEYNLGNAFGQDNPAESQLYQVYMSYGGNVDLDKMDTSNAHIAHTSAKSFKASYTGCSSNLGSTKCGSKIILDHCVVVQSPESSVISYNTLGCSIDSLFGMDANNCTVIQPRKNKLYLGAETSVNVTFNDCIYSSAGGIQLNSSTSPCLDTKSENTTYNRCEIYMSTEADGVVDNNGYGFYGLSSKNISYNECGIMYSQKGAFSLDKGAYFSGCDGITINGFRFLSDARPGNIMFSFIDTSNVKIRAIGQIDDKINMPSPAKAFIEFRGKCVNTSAARVWRTGGEKTSTYPAVTIPTIVGSNIETINCSGDYESLIQLYAQNNLRYSGVHGGSLGIGDTSGKIYTTYKGQYGLNFFDTFRSDTQGVIGCPFITPSDPSYYTVVAGKPLFFNDGDLDISPGDILELEMKYEVKGHKKFTGAFASLIGGGDYGSNETPNLKVFIQYKLSGQAYNGTWLDAKDASVLQAIPTFTSGITIKLRFETTSTYKSLSGFYLDTTTTIQDQKDNLYPIDQFESTLTLDGLKAGTEVRIYRESDMLELAGTENSGTSFAYTYTVADTVTIVVYAVGYDTIRLSNFVLSSGDTSIPIQQKIDRWYKNPI